VFDHGDLRFILLSMIAAKPAHGYDLIKALEERMGGGYSPSPGVIYPTLTMLEELGHATVTESGGKKLYAATAEGIAHLTANQATVNSVLARMKEVSAAHGGGPAPQIVRAIENLKLALRLRQSRGPLDEEQIRSIAAALDAAAVAIERS
jgi:DNA-binding PadR family transcriptional regulator